MNYKSGIATLPVVLLISVIVIGITIAGVVIAGIMSNTILSERLSAEALAVARAGAQDAAIKITRHNCFTSVSGCPSEDSENPDIINFSTTKKAEVYISDKSFVDLDGDLVDDAAIMTVSSVGSSSTRKKKVEAVVEVNKHTGKISVTSFKEEAL